MKTLKQIVNNNYSYEYVEKWIREWLMQKRQEIPIPTKDAILTSLTTRLDNALLIGKMELIDELLEELNQ